MYELTVILKDADRTLRYKFLIYEKITVNEEDPVILTCIDNAKLSFQGQPESIQVKIHMEIQ